MKMNKKEIREIRRRVDPEKTNIQHIYGCYVNSKKEIISKIDETVGLMEKEEQEKYVGLLKKTLSGALGKNLLDLSFTTKQVVDSDEHRLLSALKRTELRDPLLLDEFYKCIVQSLDMGDLNYLILIAFDSYDVPKFSRTGEREESEEVFKYIICCICPVKTGKPVLHYSNEDSRFEKLSLAQIVSSPETGFMFPSFDDRSSNIYNALFYSRNTKGIHEDLINAIFKTEVPMPAKQQEETFSSVVSESLPGECGLDVVRTLHEELSQRIELHKGSRDPEALSVSYEEMADILKRGGVTGENCTSFIDNCKEKFGENGQLAPENIISPKKFEIETENVRIKIDPSASELISAREIDGKKYILIPADGIVSVNGIQISI